MMISVRDVGPDAFCGAMIQTLIPRPVAWVLTRSANNTYNVAPFSFSTVWPRSRRF